MIVFKGQTFAECYKASLDYVMIYGRQNEARGTTSRELLDVALEVEDPTSCLYTNTARSSQMKYIAAEFLWYYMGRSDVAFIAKWAKFWEVIQNEDGTANSAYGNLIFKTKNEHGFTQYQWAIQSLLEDKNTRQATMHFNMPKHQYKGNKDFVCTMYVNAHIRDNKLYLKLNIRSNDAIWGTPTDAAFFCSLQMQMLSHLRVKYPELELGTYTHVADSYHVYDRHYELTNKMLTTEFIPATLSPVISDMITVDGEPTMEFTILFNHIYSETPDYLFFQDGEDIFQWIYKNVTKGK
jgi:thymidylate synthase